MVGLNKITPVGKRVAARQDEAGMDAIVMDIDGDAGFRLAPIAVHRDQRPANAGHGVEQGDQGEDRQKTSDIAQDTLHRSLPDPFDLDHSFFYAFDAIRFP